jgi:hypothetical protein
MSISGISSSTSIYGTQAAASPPATSGTGETRHHGKHRGGGNDAFMQSVEQALSQLGISLQAASSSASSNANSNSNGNSALASLQAPPPPPDDDGDDDSVSSTGTRKTPDKPCTLSCMTCLPR